MACQPRCQPGKPISAWLPRRELAAGILGRMAETGGSLCGAGFGQACR